jgi:hypothetical protein
MKRFHKRNQTMERQGMLRLVMKITYPKNSLTHEESDKLLNGMTYTLYFYGDCEDCEERMRKAWRPGATAELHWCTMVQGDSIAADPKRPGEWLPLHRPFSDDVSEHHTKAK